MANGNFAKRIKFLTIAAVAALALAPRSAGAQSVPDVLTGPDLSKAGAATEIKLRASGKEGTVVTFLSIQCPCSASHNDELRELAKKYTGYQFVAINSNVDEPEGKGREHFGRLALGFPVLKDKDARYADEFRALKTPHTFVIGKSGEVLYKGGVSSSTNAKEAENHFLRDALEDIEAHREVRTPYGRTLGCAIARH